MSPCPWSRGGGDSAAAHPGAVFPNPPKEPEKNSEPGPSGPLGTRDWLRGGSASLTFKSLVFITEIFHMQFRAWGSCCCLLQNSCNCLCHSSAPLLPRGPALLTSPAHQDPRQSGARGRRPQVGQVSRDLPAFLEAPLILKAQAPFSELCLTKRLAFLPSSIVLSSPGLPVSLSLGLPVSLSASLSLSQSPSLYFCLSPHLSSHLCLSLCVCFSLRFSLFSSVCLSQSLSACLFLGLSLFPSLSLFSGSKRPLERLTIQGEQVRPLPGWAAVKAAHF